MSDVNMTYSTAKGLAVLELRDIYNILINTKLTKQERIRAIAIKIINFEKKTDLKVTEDLDELEDSIWKKIAQEQKSLVEG